MPQLVPFYFFSLIESINTTVHSICITDLFALTLACFILALIAAFICARMPGVLCPRCLERDLEQWVIPGKHCRVCGCPC